MTRDDAAYKSVERFVRAPIRALSAYEEEAGEGGLNLSNNTNLFGPNPAIRRALSELKDDGFWDYPSLASASLKRAVAARHGVPEDGVVTGNGSNDLIDVIVRTFADAGDRVAFHPPTFSMIPVFVGANGAAEAPVPLTPKWGLDVDGLVRADAKVTFICSPNNPTGNAFPRRDVERVLDEAQGVVVVDEAYGEFVAGGSFLRDVPERENLIVLRTLSKAHGLAALRVGYGAMPPALAREVGKVRGPFRLNAVSEVVGVRALEDDAYVNSVIARVVEERPRLVRLLQDHGFVPFPSDANFVMARPPVDARALTAALATRGLFIRDFGGALSEFVRITVGPPDVTARLADALPGAIADARAGGDAAAR